MAAMFVNRSGRNQQSLQRTFHICFLHLYQVSVQLAKQFQEEDFQKSTNLKQELPVAAMFANKSGRNEQSLQRIFHRCVLPSFGSFGKVVSEEKISRNPPIRNMNCLWWPCLLTNRDEMINLYRGPSIQCICFLPNFSSFGKVVSQKKIFQKSTNQKKEWPVVAMFVNGLKLNEHL